MCTALSFITRSHYFGRTLDLEHHYKESVTITPRSFPLHFRKMPTLERHHAMTGIATVINGYPLYYDAVNEKGLCIAGLNLPLSACYHPIAEETDNVTPFELIPWLLGQCSCVAQAKDLLEGANLLDEAFSSELPLTPLHWMAADRNECIVVEPMADGLRIHENPVGVLTNEPTFELQRHNLNNFMHLSPFPAVNRFSEKIDLCTYSRGMGALGLPGDFSSQSRFVRAAFARFNSICGNSEEESVSQFFHILGTVDQPRGCVRLDNGSVVTVYTSCCNAERGIYYYSTYDNRRIVGVDMHREQLDGEVLVSYPLEYDGRLEILN